MSLSYLEFVKVCDNFTIAEYPTFVSKAEYINASVGIPLGPITLEVSLFIIFTADD